MSSNRTEEGADIAPTGEISLDQGDEAVVPEAADAGTVVPEAADAGTVVPEAADAEAADAETVAAEIAQSDADEAATHESDVSESEATGSEATGSEATGSEATGSEAAGSEATGSEIAGSEAAGSEATGSEATGSEATGSEATGSEAVGSQTAAGADPAAIDEGEPGASDDAVDEPAAPKRRRFRLRRRAHKSLPGRDPLWARMLIVFGAVLFVTAGSVVGASQVLAKRYEASVNRETLLAPEARTTERPRVSTITGPLNYLLIGSDLRENDPASGQRSDTIIIVHIPATMDRAYLISVPRDLRVKIPPFAPTNFEGARNGKINSAFQYGGDTGGGVQLLSQTLTDLIGIRFNGAAIIDFGGFQKVVELLGGVHMCVDVRTVSHHIGFDANGNFLAPYTGPDLSRRNYDSTPVVYEVGCYDFKPWQALDFARQRKSLDDGDYGRQRHQQQLLRAIFDKALGDGIATNPIALDRFIRAVGNSFTVDTSGVAIDDLLYSLRNVQPSALTGVTVPSEPQMFGDVSYIVALQQAEEMWAAIRDDTLDVWTTTNPQWVNQI